MQKRNMNLIVGVVILLAIAVLIGGVRFLSETKFRESTYEIRALFDNVGTLTEGDPVKINGVKKGKVTKIELEEFRVLVIMSIDKGVKITRDSRIVIQNIGLMGERMIGVQLGKGEPLAQEEVLNGEFDSGIAEAMGMLGEVLRQVQETVEELREIVQQTVGDEEFKTTFKTVLQRLERTTAVLNALIEDNKDALQGSIRDLSATASDVRQFMSQNKTRLDTTVGNVEEISGKAKLLLARAEAIAADLEELIDRINSDRSSIGRLLNDTAFVEDVKRTISNADSLVRQIKKKGIRVGFW